MAYKITRTCNDCNRRYSYMNDESPTHLCAEKVLRQSRTKRRQNKR